MHTIEVRRPLGGDDRRSVLAFLADVQGTHDTDLLSEEKAIALSSANRDVTGVLASDEGRLVGYAHLEGSNGAFATEIVTTDPEDSATLLAAVVDDVAGRGGGALAYFLPDPDDDAVAVAADAGFAVTRELFVLRRTNEPGDLIADGRDGRAGGRTAAGEPSIESFRVGRDEDAWIELNSRAFAWHPEQGQWSTRDLEEREALPWFSPAGFLCAWLGERLVGTCWTKIHADPNPVGEIYVMSVDPDLQGHGLGLVLLARGVAHLTAAGTAATILYVEGNNDPTLGLYRSFGFERSARTLVVTMDIAAR